MEMSQKDLAALAGYTYRRLLDVNKMLPDEKKLFIKGEGGKYDLALFVQNWVAYNVSRSKPESDDLDAVRAAHEHVKMQKSQLLVRKMTGELVEAVAVKRLWADIATLVQQGLLGLATKLAPMLVMMEDREQIEAIIDREVRSVLTMIADTPLPEVDDGYAEEDPPDEEE